MSNREIKLIVGLGNPGTKYALTRHNLGFLAVDAFLSSMSEEASREKFDGYYAKVRVRDMQRFFLKPQSFMNLSGEVVRKFLDQFYIEPEEVLVIHDEADLDPGVIRLKKGGGAGGHNGLRSMIAETGSRDFYRMRIGTGKHDRMDLASFLLAKAPLDVLEPMAIDASSALDKIFQQGFIKAQAEINRDE